MFKSSLMRFLFSFSTFASLGVWLGCIPVQFSTNIWVIHLLQYADQNCWHGCHSINSIIFRELIPGLSLFNFTTSGFELFFPSVCQIQFSGLCKFWCGFGVESSFIFRRAVSGFVEHLFLNTSYCQGIDVLCSRTLGMVKGQSLSFFRYAVACTLVTNTEWQVTFSRFIMVISAKHTGVSLMECCENN